MATTFAPRPALGWSGIRRARVSLWATALPLAAAVAALAAWLVVALASTHSTTTIVHEPATQVQQIGGADQGGPVCTPSRNTVRFC